MQRLNGSYSIRSEAIRQYDYQIEPQQWKSFEGRKLPIRGPFTEVICDRGMAILYVSQPGEVPLFYSTTPGWIHWSEQKLALPGRGKTRIHHGELVCWTPQRLDHIQFEHPIRPPIRSDVPTTEQAIAEYQQRLIHAVKVRLGNHQRVAVAQSGGVDSLMVTWALLKAGVEVVPMTVYHSNQDLDIVGARSGCGGMGLEVLPIHVTRALLKDIIPEAVLCFEEPDELNVRMAAGNILMAEKCKKLGIQIIFHGHGQDDIFGAEALMKVELRKQSAPTEVERWRDARISNALGTHGMRKMFSVSFRRYGIEARMPYFDADLLSWVYSQPLEILPIEFKKQFARKVFQVSLPPGKHLDKEHSLGYTIGSGMYKSGNVYSEICTKFSLQNLVRRLKEKDHKAIAQMHNL